MKISTHTLLSSPVAASSSSPGQNADLAYWRDLKALQGHRYSYVDAADPTKLVVDFATPDLRALADNVLRDGVIGATLVFTSPPGAPSGPTEPGELAWYDTVAAMARSVAAMPGVVNYHWAGHLGEMIVFRTTTPEVARHLEALVTPRMGASVVVFAPATPSR